MLKCLKLGFIIQPLTPSGSLLGPHCCADSGILILSLMHVSQYSLPNINSFIIFFTGAFAKVWRELPTTVLPPPPSPALPLRPSIYFPSLSFLAWICTCIRSVIEHPVSQREMLLHCEANLWVSFKESSTVWQILTIPISHACIGSPESLCSKWSDHLLMQAKADSGSPRGTSLIHYTPQSHKSQDSPPLLPSLPPNGTLTWNLFTWDDYSINFFHYTCQKALPGFLKLPCVFVLMMTVVPAV